MFELFTTMRRPLLPGPFARAFPDRAQKVMDPDLADNAAETLAGLINEARQQAIASGVKPLPPAIHRDLLGYFPASLLDRARYAANGVRPLCLPDLALSYGDATAMTLGEVVLLKNQATARFDLKVWAHELSRVMQYQRWGIGGFADRYVRDSDAVEREAGENAERFVRWRRKDA